MTFNDEFDAANYEFTPDQCSVLQSALKYAARRTKEDPSAEAEGVANRLNELAVTVPKLAAEGRLQEINFMEADDVSTSLFLSAYTMMRDLLKTSNKEQVMVLREMLLATLWLEAIFTEKHSTVTSEADK